MGRDRTEHQAADVSPSEGINDGSANQAPDEAVAPGTQRSVLPKDLPKAIKYLNDGEFDRLLAAVIDEGRRRGRLPRILVESSAKAVSGSTRPIAKEPQSSDRPSRRQHVELTSRSLTRGQIRHSADFCPNVV